MSVRVQGWVWEYSRAKGTTLLVALALADHAHHDGSGAYPSIESIAEKARCQVRAVQRSIRELVKLGEVSVAYGAGPNRTNVYSFPNVRVSPETPRQKDTLSPETPCPTGHPVTGDTPSSTTSEGVISDIGRVSPETPKPSLGTVREPEPSPLISPLPPRRSAPAHKQVDEEFIQRMVGEWGVRLGGEQAVRDAIADAMNHTASDKRKDKRLYVQSWLRRNAERHPAVNGRHAVAPGNEIADAWDRVKAERRAEG